MSEQRTQRTWYSLYCCLVGIAGWALLLVYTIGSTIDASLIGLVFFIALSTSSKRLGVRVGQDITYSLVGVVDLAVLYIFGVPAALIVTAASSALSHLLDIPDRAPAEFKHIIRLAFFNSGLNALMVLATAAVYRTAGGKIPLAEVTWRSLFPAGAASLTWFILDHLGWALTRVTADGVRGGIRFLREIIRYSLLFELLPLPFAILISSAYLKLSAPLFVISCAVFLGLGIAIRQLAISLEMERRRAAEQSVLTEMGRRFLQAGSQPGHSCALIGEFCYRMLPVPVYVVSLDCPELEPQPGIAVLRDGECAQESETLRLLPASWPDEPGQPALARDLTQDAHAGPAARSGLYVPIYIDASLAGSITALSPHPAAFKQEDLQALEMVAAQAALGLRGVQFYRREQQRSRQLTTIAEISQKVTAILDLNTLFKDSARLIQSSFGYYCVNLFTVDQESQQVHFAASSSPVIQQRGIAIAWGKGMIGSAAASGVSALANDVRQDPRFLTDSVLENTRAELAIPMKVEDRILGVLDLQCDHINAFDQQDAVVLQTLADQIAIAIEDSRIYHEQQAQAWVSTALLQVAETLAEHTTAEDILASVARLTQMLGGVHCCMIFLWSEEERVFTAIQSAGLSPEQAEVLRNQRFELGAIPLLERVYREEQVLTGHTADITSYLPPPFGELAGCDQLLVLPLRAKGAINGVMVAAEPEGEAYLASYRRNILLGIANNTALALDNARLYASQAEEAWVSAALLRVANTITISRSLEDIINTVVHLTPLLAGVTWSTILLWEEERGAFFAARSNGLPPGLREQLDGQYLSPAMLNVEPRSLENGQMVPLRLEHIESLDSANTGVLAWALRSPDRFLGMLAVGVSDGRTLNSRRRSIITGIANQASLAIETYQLYQRTLEQQRLQRSLELAHDIQEGFLPETCPHVPGYDIAAEWRAARGVGGDYYDFLPLDQTRLGLVIGDVSDKGVAAALYMALSRAVVRAAALGMLGPAETLTRANRILMEESRSGMFISLFYAILDTGTGRLQYARAGHNPPILLRAEDNSIIQLDAPGTVLGVTDNPRTLQESVTLLPGDVLVMYTDGVTEAVNEVNEEFGEERLRQLIQHAGDLPAGALIERINAAVRIFCGEREQFDDFTLLVVKRERV